MHSIHSSSQHQDNHFSFCLSFIEKCNRENVDSSSRIYAYFKELYPTPKQAYVLLETVSANQMLFCKWSSFVYFELMFLCLSDLEPCLLSGEIPEHEVSALLMKVLSTKKTKFTQGYPAGLFFFDNFYVVTQGSEKAFLQTFNKAMSIFLKCLAQTLHVPTYLHITTCFYKKAVESICLKIYDVHARKNYMEIGYYHQLLIEINTSLDILFQLHEPTFSNYFYESYSSRILINQILTTINQRELSPEIAQLFINTLSKHLTIHLRCYANNIFKTKALQRELIDHLVEIERFLRKYKNSSDSLSVFENEASLWFSLDADTHRQMPVSPMKWKSLLSLMINKFHEHSIILPFSFIFKFLIITLKCYDTTFFKDGAFNILPNLEKLYDPKFSNIEQCTAFLKAQPLSRETAPAMKQMLEIYTHRFYCTPTDAYASLPQETIEFCQLVSSYIQSSPPQQLITDNSITIAKSKSIPEISADQSSTPALDTALGETEISATMPKVSLLLKTASKKQLLSSDETDLVNFIEELPLAILMDNSLLRERLQSHLPKMWSIQLLNILAIKQYVFNEKYLCSIFYSLCLADIAKRISSPAVSPNYLFTVYTQINEIFEKKHNVKKIVNIKSDNFLKIMNQCLEIFFHPSIQCYDNIKPRVNFDSFYNGFARAITKLCQSDPHKSSTENLLNIAEALRLIFKNILVADQSQVAPDAKHALKLTISNYLVNINNIVEYALRLKQDAPHKKIPELIAVFEQNIFTYLKISFENLDAFIFAQNPITYIMNFQRLLDEFFPKKEALFNALNCDSLLCGLASSHKYFQHTLLAHFIEAFEKCGRAHLSFELIYAFFATTHLHNSPLVPPSTLQKFYHPEKTSLAKCLQFLENKDRSTPASEAFLAFYEAAEQHFLQFICSSTSTEVTYTEFSAPYSATSSSEIVQHVVEPALQASFVAKPKTSTETIRCDGKRKVIGKSDIQKILEKQPANTNPDTMPRLLIEDFDYGSVSFDDLQQLAEHHHIFADTLFFGIHEKYSTIRAAAPIPLSLKEHIPTPPIPKRNHHSHEMATQNFTAIDELTQCFAAPVDPTPIFECEAYTLYTSTTLNLSLPAITIFAGRKAKALIPPASHACVFIILTAVEYQELGDYRYNLLTLGYHILVINAPWGIDASSSRLKALTEQSAEASKLTARRRAAMLLCYDFSFNTLIMMDDNIASLTCATDSLEPSWANILNQLLSYHSEADGIISTVQTHAPKNLTTHHSNRIGWKILLFKMEDMRRLFSRAQSYFIFPCALTASSEDAFVQLVTHIAAQRSALPRPGFTRLSLEQSYLVRVKNRGSLNACAKSGVFAQRLTLEAHEESAAKTYLNATQFESLRMAMLIFNKNISLNEDIRVKSNTFRTEFDIPASILKKRKQDEIGDSIEFSLSAECQSFQQALEQVAAAEALNLRAPQTQCLKIIAQAPEKSDSLLVAVLPTGAGKTRIEAYLAYAMSHAHPDSHTIIIAPTRTLSEQIDADFYNEGCQIDKKYRQRLIAVYSSNNSPAASLTSLLQNKRVQSNTLGHIFVFCLKSFHELIKIATTPDALLHREALMLLARLKMFIFDEEHLTFSLEVARLLKELGDNNKLPRLSHTLGLTATSPADLRYKNSFKHLKTETAAIGRKIVFSYSPEQAQESGFIRPILYQVAQHNTISSFYGEYCFTDGTPLFHNVGIIVCESIAQIIRVEKDLKENLPALNVYDIHSAAKDFYQKIQDFSNRKNHAVALVVDMLKEGYNHPEVRYTVMLKKHSSAANKEQRAGRTRRKTHAHDNHCALFVELTLTSELRLKESLEREDDSSALGRRRQAGSDIEDIANSTPSSAISFSSSSALSTVIAKKARLS